MKIYESLIILWWAAGIWIGIKLNEVWVETIILEAKEIWSSFKNWNSQTRFISPIFPSNWFGQVDLNSVNFESSPWFMFMKEHLSGIEYAQYLKNIAVKNNINISEWETVIKIKKEKEYFVIITNKSKYFCKFLISATWEFSFPFNGNILGSHFAIHSWKLNNYNNYNKSENIVAIIGWYESAIDCAYWLYKKWIKSHLFSKHKIDEIKTQDVSEILSPVSFQKFQELKSKNYISQTYTHINSIKKNNKQYILTWKNNEEYYFYETPILAIWFRSWLDILNEYISFRSDGNPLLNKNDESVKINNIFIVWPQVRQKEVIFCFIYKFRLRFWIVALEIAKRLWKNIDYKYLENKWEKQWFYIKNSEELKCECSC